MNDIEIIDINGNKTKVKGIYYISNNSNYYFIYTKGEQDSNNHIIFYIVKVLKEVSNGINGPSPTGFLIGVKVNDDNEYNIVKNDITTIISDKENNTESIRYLDISLLAKLKVQDNRMFKIKIDTYNKLFNSNNQEHNISSVDDNYEKVLNENNILKNKLEELTKKIDLIKKIVD